MLHMIAEMLFLFILFMPNRKRDVCNWKRILRNTMSHVYGPIRESQLKISIFLNGPRHTHKDGLVCSLLIFPPGGSASQPLCSV